MTEDKEAPAQERDGYFNSRRDGMPIANKAPSQECQHRTFTHHTGDGIEVEFCPECGRNVEIDGVPIKTAPSQEPVWYEVTDTEGKKHKIAFPDKAAPPQEPDNYFAKYLVERNQKQAAEAQLTDAAAQIADWKKTVMDALEMCKERDEQIAKLQASLNAAQNVADDSFKQIADLQRSEELCRNAADRLRVELDQLQAENAELREALVHYDFWTDVPQQAVNAIDSVLSGAPVKEG